MFRVKLNKNVNNFHPLEVVGRGSERQLQVVGNLDFYDAGLESIMGVTVVISIDREKNHV